MSSFETDWQVGSEMVWHQGDVAMAGPGQVVLEHDPYRRLSYTWHHITPEFAKAVEMDDDLLRRRPAAEPLSKVTFELEPAGDQVKLTVIHTGFEPGSAIREMIERGLDRT